MTAEQRRAMQGAIGIPEKLLRPEPPMTVTELRAKRAAMTTYEVDLVFTEAGTVELWLTRRTSPDDLR